MKEIQRDQKKIQIRERTSKHKKKELLEDQGRNCNRTGFRALESNQGIKK